MKTKKRHKTTSLFGLMIAVFTPCFALAGGYVQREPIPGYEPTSNFIQYLSNLYGFGIGIAAILAIFMIALGAFVYIVTSAGNASKMGDAKDMIFNAIYGLVIVLIAYLILFVVNPDLVRGTIDTVPHMETFKKEDPEDNGNGEDGKSHPVCSEDGTDGKECQLYLGKGIPMPWGTCSGGACVVPTEEGSDASNDGSDVGDDNSDNDSDLGDSVFTDPTIDGGGEGESDGGDEGDTDDGSDNSENNDGTDARM